MDQIPLIEIDRLYKKYGSVMVFENLSCQIRTGITGLLGANGTGKTTLLGMVLGLQSCDSGELKVLGRNPTKAGPEVRAKIGYGPEHHLLPPLLRANDFVRHVAELHGLPSTEAKTRASDALWLVGLGEERHRPLGTMSTGQRQRVKLAQAIAHDPSLVILDEPTDGLDPDQREVMLDLIKTVSKQFGINVIVSSHLMAEIEQICDAAVIIGGGRCLRSDTIGELQGGKSQIQVELDSTELDTSETNLMGLAQQLESAGYSLQQQAMSLLIATPESESTNLYDLIRDYCATNQLGITRMGPLTSTLEDVFLETTQ